MTITVPEFRENLKYFLNKLHSEKITLTIIDEDGRKTVLTAE